MSKVACIFARSENRCIGFKGDLPWRLPDEMAFFERTTMGYPVIMGRKTFEDHESVLPGRRNIVISATRTNFPDGIEVASGLQEALERCAGDTELCFVIGGVSLWLEAFSQADLIFETIVHAEFAGDTFLPPLDLEAWQHETVLHHPVDKRHNSSFTIHRHSRV